MGTTKPTKELFGRGWRSLAGMAVLAMLLSACEAPGDPGAGRLAPGLARLAAGNGGYTGEIRPITTPITLEFGEVADATVKSGFVSRLERGSEVKESFFDATVKVTTRQAAQNTIMDMRLVEYKEARGTIAPRLPIMQILALSSKAGELRDLTVSFPFAKDTRRPEPAKDSDEYKEMLRAMRAGFTPFSGQIRKSGDPVYSIDFPEFVARSLGMEMTAADRQQIKWSGGVTALGLTTVNQRLSLLARIDGRLTGSEGSRDIEIQADGFYALDLVTGLPNDGLLRSRIETKSNGIRQNAADVIVSMKTTY
jgi:hypothetical protein